MAIDATLGEYAPL